MRRWPITDSVASRVRPSCRTAETCLSTRRNCKSRINGDFQFRRLLAATPYVCIHVHVRTSRSTTIRKFGRTIRAMFR